jgi:hypothetical protein
MDTPKCSPLCFSTKMIIWVTLSCNILSTFEYFSYFFHVYVQFLSKNSRNSSCTWIILVLLPNLLLITLFCNPEIPTITFLVIPLKTLQPTRPFDNQTLEPNLHLFNNVRKGGWSPTSLLVPQISFCPQISRKFQWHLPLGNLQAYLNFAHHNQ